MMNGEKATLLYRAGHLLARFCFSVFGRFEVKGQEWVPPYGPVILVSNHLSFNDPPLLVASIRRPLHFVGKRELFGNPFTRFIMNGFHVSPFNRSTAGVDAIKVLLRGLGRDQVVVIFPEGHRSRNHTLQRGMLGVVYLALKSQAPILPVGVTGTEKFSGWRMGFPLCRMTANIGQPFTLPMLEGKPSKEVMNGLLDTIMYRIADLLPPEYRGEYPQPDQSERDAASHAATPVEAPVITKPR